MSDSCSTSIDQLLAGSAPPEQPPFNEQPRLQTVQTPPGMMPKQQEMALNANSLSLPTESFMPGSSLIPGYPLIKTLGLDEKMVKGLVIAVIILTAVQMPQVRKFVIDALPPILKTGIVVESSSISVVTVALTYLLFNFFA